MTSMTGIVGYRPYVTPEEALGHGHVGAATTSTGSESRPGWFPIVVVGGIFAIVGITLYLQATGKIKPYAGPYYPPYGGYGYGYEPGLSFRIA